MNAPLIGKSSIHSPDNYINRFTTYFLSLNAVSDYSLRYFRCMKIQCSRILESLKFRFRRLIILFLFRDRTSLISNFGSYISPKEIRVGNDLELHFAIKPLMDKLVSEKIELPLIRIGSTNDGGYVLLDKDYSKSLLISGGISNDNNFELALGNLGAKVHQIDYSITVPPREHPLLTFSAERIVGEKSKDSKLDVTLDELVARIPNLSGLDLLLKLDIEGSEWDVLETSQTLDKFDQIFLELHYMDRISNPNYAKKSIKALERLLKGFFPVFISGNNCCGFVILGGFAVPRVIEMTLLNRCNYSPLFRDQEQINEKFQSQNYPNKAPLVMKNW